MNIKYCEICERDIPIEKGGKCLVNDFFYNTKGLTELTKIPKALFKKNKKITKILEDISG